MYLKNIGRIRGNFQEVLLEKRRYCALVKKMAFGVLAWNADSQKKRGVCSQLPLGGENIAACASVLSEAR